MWGEKTGVTGEPEASTARRLSSWSPFCTATVFCCSDKPEATVSCSDKPEATVSCSDKPEAAVSCSDEPGATVSCSDKPGATVPCSDKPEATVSCSDKPGAAVCCSDKPEAAVSCSDKPEVLSHTASNVGSLTVTTVAGSDSSCSKLVLEEKSLMEEGLLETDVAFEILDTRHWHQ